MKILNIKERNWFVRTFLPTVDCWRVTVELDDGRIKQFNCWGNIHNPSLDSIIWSLKGKVREFLQGETGEIDKKQIESTKDLVV